MVIASRCKSDSTAGTSLTERAPWCTNSVRARAIADRHYEGQQSGVLFHVNETNNSVADRRVVLAVKSVFSGWLRTLVDAGQCHIEEITLSTLLLWTFDFGENKISRYFS